MPDVILSVINDRITAKCHFRFKDLCKSIPGGRWSPVLKCWQYPASPAMAKQMHQVFGDLSTQIDGQFEVLLRNAFAVVEAAKHKVDRSLPDIPRTATIPWLHQKQAFWFAHDLDTVMLAMEMGTGKSKVVVDLAVNRSKKKILITCPLSVVGVWPREFERHSAAPWNLVRLD